MAKNGLLISDSIQSKKNSSIRKPRKVQRKETIFILRDEFRIVGKEAIAASNDLTNTLGLKIITRQAQDIARYWTHKNTHQ